MKKQIKMLPVLSLSIMVTACVSGGGSVPIVDDAGYTHYTKNMDADRRDYAFPAHREATGKKIFIFDPKLTAWAAYDAQGNLVQSGSASGGKDYCDDVGHECRTVTGTFHVYSKKGEDCTSSIYPIETGGGARMPYCMHFSGGYSIHAAYEVPNANVSHGCIRVQPAAAQWLNQNFMDIGTTVVVKPYAT